VKTIYTGLASLDDVNAAAADASPSEDTQRFSLFLLFSGSRDFTTVAVVISIVNIRVQPSQFVCTGIPTTVTPHIKSSRGGTAHTAVSSSRSICHVEIRI
jgi:hypothetical protein